MPLWTKDHHVFTYDTFVKSGEPVVETHRCFRRYIHIGRHGEIPNRNTILRWVDSFRSTGSVMKTKPPGPAPSALTPQNMGRVREAILRSPGRSAGRHATENVQEKLKICVRENCRDLSDVIFKK